MACSSINRQAIGIVEQLDKPLYEVIRPKPLLCSDVIQPHNTCLGTNDNGVNGSTDILSDHGNGDSAEKLPTRVEIMACSPTVVTVGTHIATISWDPVDLTGAEPSTEQLDSVTYHLEVQQVDTSGNSDDYVTNLTISGRDGDWKCFSSGKQRSAKISTLRPGRCYLARMRYSCSPLSNSLFIIEPIASPPVCFKTVSTAPGAPQPPSLSARARNNLKFKWSVPEETGGEQILYYVLQMTPAPIGQDTSLTEGYAEVYRGVEKTYKVTRLQPGVKYTVRVKAANKIGEGPFSLCSVYTTQASVPSIPEPPQVSSVTSDSLVLRWRPPADNGTPITCYVLERDDGHGGDFQLAYAGQELQAAVRQLQSGVVYRFRLRADNDEGKGSWCSPAAFTTAASPPGSPKPVSVLEVHKTSATVSWDSPEYDGGSEVTGFEVQLQAKTKAAASVMGADWLTIYSGYTTACTINSLIAGCSYRVRVKACNTAGYGLWSVPADLVTLSEVPLAPYDLRAVDVTSSSLVVTWELPIHDGGAKITTYRLDLRPVPCSCSTTSCPSGHGGAACSAAGESEYRTVYIGTDNTATVAELEPGSQYSLRVQAVNSEGPGPWSQSTILLTQPAVPCSPAAPVAQHTTSTSISWKWSVPNGRGAAVLNYAVEVAKVGDPRQASHPDKDNTCVLGLPESPDWSKGIAFECLLKGGDNSCEAKSLEPYTLYGARVRACNSVGWSDWSEVGLVNTGAFAPGPPEGLQATGLHSTELEVAWDPPQRDNGSPITSYLLEYCLQATSSSGSSLGGSRRLQPSWIQAYQGVKNRFCIKQLVPGKSYQLRVRANNSCGSGPFSAVVTTATQAAPPSAPSKPSVSDRKATSVRAKWQYPDEDNGAPVSSYVLQVAAANEEFESVYSGTDMMHKVSSLAPGTKYLMRVAGVNSAGAGEFSEPEAFTTALLPPGPPHGVEVDVAPLSNEYSRIHVKWQVPEGSSSVAEVIGYEVAAVPDGVVASTVKQTVGRVTECQMHNMAPGTSFTFRLRAVGAEGTGHSSWSDPITVATPGVKRVFSDARSETSETSSLVSTESGRQATKAGKKKRNISKRTVTQGELESEVSVDKVKRAPSDKLLKVAPATAVVARAPPKRHIIPPKLLKMLKQCLVTVLIVAVVVLLCLAASSG